MEKVLEKTPLIGGRAVPTGDVCEVRSPGSGDLVARIHRAGPAQIEAALAAAAEAFETTRRQSSFERAGILEGIAARVRERSEELARVVSREAGKPIRAARVELERCAHTFRAAAAEATRMSGEMLPLDAVPWADGRIGITRRFPIGPVAGITPFNFPINLPAHKIAPAIASGCPIVIKPASQTPSPLILLGEIAAESGAVAGSVSVLPAGARDAAPLIEDDRVGVVSFTGSAEVGWELKRRAGRKRVCLELGGNAAVIVCSDTDLDAAARSIIAGGFTYAGQSCISVQRIFVEETVREALLERLLAGVGALRVGPGLGEEIDVGPMISPVEAERAESWIREAVDEGARVLAGGGRRNDVLEPTVLTGTGPRMKVNRMEIFAPVVTVTPFRDFGEALSAVNASAYGLQAGVYSNDAERIWRAFDELEVGGVIVNDVPTFRVDHMPYGGVKASGQGREGIRYAIEEMTELRLLVWNRPR